MHTAYLSFRLHMLVIGTALPAKAVTSRTSILYDALSQAKSLTAPLGTTS